LVQGRAGIICETRAECGVRRSPAFEKGEISE
jgi:hypothetical protein